MGRELGGICDPRGAGMRVALREFASQAVGAIALPHKIPHDKNFARQTLRTTNPSHDKLFARQRFAEEFRTIQLRTIPSHDTTHTIELHPVELYTIGPCFPEVHTLQSVL